MKEGKDDRKAASKPKVEASKARVAIRVNIEDNNSNSKQKGGGRSKEQNMDQPKDMLAIEIEEMWELMMKQSKWRKMVVAASKINQILNLIDKKKKTIDIQQQQRYKASKQLQNKVWDPGRPRPKDT